MKTLYITDLDGTFLNSDAKLTKKSSDILNFLIDKGLLFTVATARTQATVLDLFASVNLNIPFVLMNGVLVYDPLKERDIICHDIDNSTAELVIDIFKKHNKTPMLYYKKDTYLEIVYGDLENKHQMSYVSNRTDLTRKKFIYSPVLSLRKNDKLIYIVALDRPDEIEGAYNEIVSTGKVTAAFYSDNYTDCNFLECMNKNASKATGALEIKKLLGVDKIVAFGDNLNDMPLFEIADECYAVSNGAEELKRIATGVIGSNDEDAVAKFLLERYNDNSL